jgi:hypothetical protein
MKIGIRKRKNPSSVGVPVKKRRINNNNNNVAQQDTHNADLEQEIEKFIPLVKDILEGMLHYQ